VPRPLPPGVSYLGLGIGRVRATIEHIKDRRDLAVILVSIFFAMSGIYIIITYAFIYGAQIIGWDEEVRTWMFIIVQIAAALGAVAFGFVQDRLGALLTYRMTLVMWILAIALIYATPNIAEAARIYLGLDWQAQYVFLVVGSAAGLSLGSCQSSTRTLVGLFSPLSHSAEYFGFWGLSMKLAGVMGLLAIGLLQILVGLKSAILFCVVLFGLALFLSRNVDEARGRDAAGKADSGSLEEDT
jgi:MFS transporter, UMF1 family